MQSTEIKTESPKLKINTPLVSTYYTETEIDLPYFFKAYLTETMVKIESANKVIEVDNQPNGRYVGIACHTVNSGDLGKRIAEGTLITEEEFEAAKELAKAKINAL
jgi:hypothetical protein